MEDLERQVEALSRLVERIAAREGSVLPVREIYPRDEAAVLLGGISRRTLDRMVVRGEISTCPLGLRRAGGIPRSEIERIATPTPAAASAPQVRRGPRPKAERSARDEAEAIRALTRRR